MVCKFWLTPVVLSMNHGFSARELNRIRAIILDNRHRILEAGMTIVASNDPRIVAGEVRACLKSFH